MNKKLQLIVMIFFLSFLISTNLFAQHIYSYKYDQYNNIESILKTNIFTLEQIELINLLSLGYERITGVWSEHTDSKLFVCYNDGKNLVMIDIENPNQITDLSRNIGDFGPDAGAGYNTVYNHSTGKLYLLWTKFDPDITTSNSTGIIDSCAVVDPANGETLNFLDPFFRFRSAKFSEDGNKVYAAKKLSLTEMNEGEFIMLILDANTDEIIESISRTEIAPDAQTMLVVSGVKNELLIHIPKIEGKDDEGYLYVFNLDTKQRSKRIRFDGRGECRLSSDGTKIIISEKKSTNYYKDRSGKIYILDVDWNDPTEIIQVTDGITLQIPPFTTQSNRTSVIQTFNSNPDVFLLYDNLSDKPIEESYLIRISNGEFLRGEPISSGLPVKFVNSQNQLILNGQLKYYEGGWKEAENHGDGTFSIDTDQATVKLRMTYAFASQDMENVAVNGDTAIFQTVLTNVELRNSQNQLIDEGTVKYYSGGWREFGVTSGGITVKELLPKNYSFRMSYAFASNDKQQDIGADPTVVFQTVSARIELQNSSGALIDEGTVKYYSGGWQEFGITSGGVAVKELLPKSYSFRMSYAFASNDKQQDIGADPTVVFQTVPAQVELQNSSGGLIDEGTVQYYSGGWREFGVTSSGVAVKELLPKNYSFRMSYAFASNDKQQDIGTDPTIIFQTVPAQVELRNSSGTLMDEGTVQYYSGGWRELGVTSGGVAVKELLPKSYSFRMSYAFAFNDKQQDIGADPTLVFSTILATINVTNQDSQPVNGAETRYYSGGWRTIGTTVNGSANIELLPKSYSFRAVFSGTSQDKQQDISIDPVVNIQLEL